MSSTNDFFSSVFRTFGFLDNPSLSGAGSEAAANMQDMIRQHLESQTKLFTATTACILASTGKVIDLNMNAARTWVQENSTLANRLLASQSTNDLPLLFAALPQATSTKAVAYGHHLTSIAVEINARTTGGNGSRPHH